MPLNILKLCVGAESVEDLQQWHAQHQGLWPKGTTEHITRMWPKREAEVLDGGSLYWVIKGVVWPGSGYWGWNRAGDRTGSNAARWCWTRR